jgi:hypothetical protein
VAYENFNLAGALLLNDFQEMKDMKEEGQNLQRHYWC